MSSPLRALGVGALVALAGVLVYGNWRQSDRLDALAQELSSLREELRSARGAAGTAAPALAAYPPAAAPAPPASPEAIATQVVQLLERQRAIQPPPVQPEPSRPPPPLPAEARAVLERAQRLADSVLASGVMRPEDAVELKEALGKLGPREEARAIRQRFIVASNRGQLQLPPGVSPFLF